MPALTFVLSEAGKIQWKYLAFDRYSIAQSEIMSTIIRERLFIIAEKNADGSCRRKKTHKDNHPVCLKKSNSEPY